MNETTTTTEVKLHWWPTPQDYNEAVQNPLTNLSDSELQTGAVAVDSFGIPRPVTGAFASVYRMECESKDFALRCFLRKIDDQEKRYALISNFVQNDDLPYTVTFDFLKTGIKVANQWIPVLKMEWVEGETLDTYIMRHLGSPRELARLGEAFRQLCDDLRGAGIAHGDLQHGNVIVCQEGLRLVDYDGMYVPEMEGFSSNELGHRNYQHPLRAAQHFGPKLDNFSAWVIYASIRAFQINPHLWRDLVCGDDCLLFRQTDFKDPLASHAFAALERQKNRELQNLGRFIRAQLKVDPDMVPPLQLPVPRVEGLEPLKPTTLPVRPGPRLVWNILRDWFDDDDEEHIQAERQQPTPTLPAVGGARQIQTAKSNCTLPVNPGQTKPSRGRKQSKKRVPAAASTPTAAAAQPGTTSPRNRRTHVLEEELKLPVPRKVKLNEQALIMMHPLFAIGQLFFITFMLFVLWHLFASMGPDWKCLTLTAAFIYLESIYLAPSKEEKRLAQLGSPALAKIVNKRVTGSGKKDSGHEVDFRFQTKDGRKVIVTQKVPILQFHDFHLGDAVSVLYDPETPHDAVIYRLCRYRPIG